jgi:hypothetical protein
MGGALEVLGAPYPTNNGGTASSLKRNQHDWERHALPSDDFGTMGKELAMF